LEWLPLEVSWRIGLVPYQPGLYRIRGAGSPKLDYIGKGTMTLHKRLAMLRVVYERDMPYRDPHTAAPAL